MIKNYLFDLDGTLLPLNEDKFVEKYMKLIGQKFVALGYNPKIMIDQLWLGTKAMINNNGKNTNEAVFWEIFNPKKMNSDKLKEQLNGFYKNEFSNTFKATKPSDYSKKIISLLKEKSKRIILATNPIFPLVATKRRIEWAKLDINDFEYITTYENSAYAKPNTDYYKEILEKMNLETHETIMIGNDATEDMIAQELGIQTYLVTDCLKNKNNIDINKFNHGTLEELYKLIKSDSL